MAGKRLTDLAASTALTGVELLEVSQPSTTVKVTGATISAVAADNSFNDSANGFLVAGLAVGDRVTVIGFAAGANNLQVGIVTAVTAGKLTIGGTDGDAIVDEAAGPAVTIAKWVTKRATLQAIAAVVPAGAPSVQTVVSAATVTPTFANDLVRITAQAVALTIANWTGAAVEGWGMVIRVKDDGTARGIAFGSKYRAMGVALPTTTVVGKTTYIAVVYNATDDKFDVIAVRQEA